MPLADARFGGLRSVLARVAPIASASWRVLVLVWLAAHFALTVLFVAPTNPLSIELQPLLQAYIGGLFYQNWSFFAPDPVQTNDILLVLPLREVPQTASGLMALPDTGWYDLSSPAWHAFQANRFAAYDRVSRPQSNLVRTFFNLNLALRGWGEACTKGDKASCELLQKESVQERGESTKQLVRIASSFVRDLAGSSLEGGYVALRIRRVEAVPWSERGVGKPKLTDFELGVFPLQPDVAPSGLFRPEQVGRTTPLASNHSN